MIKGRDARRGDWVFAITWVQAQRRVEKPSDANVGLLWMHMPQGSGKIRRPKQSLQK